jgi:hypothetical protein
MLHRALAPSGKDSSSFSYFSLLYPQATVGGRHQNLMSTDARASVSKKTKIVLDLYIICTKKDTGKLISSPIFVM